MSQDPNAGPALPPELMALLAGGGAGAPAGPQDPSAGASDPSAQSTDQSQSGDGLPSDPVGIIKMMIDLAKKYLDVEPDEEDKATMASNVLSKLQQYLAKDQKDGEQMLSGTISPRAMRRAGSGSAQG